MSGLLLDTHAFLWLMLGDPRVPAETRDLVLESDEVYVSAATAWEIRTKHRLGKLPEAGAYVLQLGAAAAQAGFRTMPVTFEDGERAGAFTVSHKDPFDRMLAAQALNRALPLVSNDAALDAFGVIRVW